MSIRKIFVPMLAKYDLRDDSEVREFTLRAGLEVGRLLQAQV